MYQAYKHKHYTGLILSSIFPPASLMSTLGYVALPDTQSRAISAMTLECRSPTPMEEVDMGPTRSEVRVQMEKDQEDAVSKLKEEHELNLGRLESHYQ